MVKKLFALAGVSALTGLVSAATMAGCSSSDETSRAAAIVPDAGYVVTNYDDAGPEASRNTEASRRAKACLTKDAIDATQLPYSTPIKAPGSCTKAEADKLVAIFDTAAEANLTPTVSEWSAAVGDTCANCVFTSVDADKWGPILFDGDTIENVNMGGCVELVSGKAECGQSLQQYSACQIDACKQDCDTDEAFEACIADTEALQDGPCHDATQAVIDSCGEDIGDYQKGCAGEKWAFEGPVNVMCVSGTAKVGID